jgi:hypothetical protein
MDSNAQIPPSQHARNVAKRAAHKAQKQAKYAAIAAAKGTGALGTDSEVGQWGHSCRWLALTPVGEVIYILDIQTLRLEHGNGRRDDDITYYPIVRQRLYDNIPNFITLDFDFFALFDL